MGLAAPAFTDTKPSLVGNSVASDARKLKALEEEKNSKLKKLLAETMLVNAILKVAVKNGNTRG